MGTSLSDRVRAVLDEQGIKQADLWKVAGVSKGLVSQWLNDQRDSIGYDAASKISRRYGYSVDWLMTGRLPKRLGDAVQEPAAQYEAGGPIDADERALLARYRQCDKRWQLSLRLLSMVATENMDEVAEGVNVILAKVFSKRPEDIRPIPDARVEASLANSRHGFPPGKLLPARSLGGRAASGGALPHTRAEVVKSAPKRRRNR